MAQEAYFKFSTIYIDSDSDWISIPTYGGTWHDNYNDYYKDYTFDIYNNVYQTARAQMGSITGRGGYYYAVPAATPGVIWRIYFEGESVGPNAIHKKIVADNQQQIGKYLETVTAEYGTYPSDGLHTDGFWYRMVRMKRQKTDSRIAIKDTYSVSNGTDSNAGYNPILPLRYKGGGPGIEQTRNPYFAFDLTGINPTDVLEAKLWLYIESGNDPIGVTGGYDYEIDAVVAGVANTWDENGVTYSSPPEVLYRRPYYEIDHIPLGNTGWVTINVEDIIESGCSAIHIAWSGPYLDTGNDPYGIGMDFASRHLPGKEPFLRITYLEANNAPTLVMKKSDSTVITDGSAFEIPYDTDFIVKFTPNDADTGDTIQYRIFVNGVEKVPFTSATKNVELSYTVLKTDLMIGYNTIKIEVRDSKYESTVQQFALTMTADSPIDWSSLSHLKFNSYAKNTISLAELINHIKLEDFN